ncbi:MAG TPA: FRG domain-containing protein, partial [Flavisolibacter sp.]
MEPFNYSTIRLPSWHEFKLTIHKFSENWAFRGQANAGWMLNNAIERTDFIRFGNGIEAGFVAEFQRGARNYLSKDETPEHLIEWLALMQHHGAPTRLLDFSKSPYIAAYFAFEFCHV